jgi:hypothetical protein
VFLLQREKKEIKKKLYRKFGFKIGEEDRIGSAWKLGGKEGAGGSGEMAQTMYVHMNK